MNKSNHIYCKKKALSKFYCDELIKFFDICPWSKSGHAGVDGNIMVDRSVKNSIDKGICKKISLHGKNL